MKTLILYLLIRDWDSFFRIEILRAVRIRLAPSLAKASAQALPIPALAPVIKIILFDSFGSF